MSKKEKNENEELEQNQEVNEQEEIIAKLKNDFELKSEEAAKNYESLQRLMAEFDNYKKRSARERESLYNSLVGDIITDFLEIIDNLDKAIESAEESSFKQGIELIRKQFIDTLKKYNVEEIKALNETFDPNYHESINHVDDEQYGEQEVIEVFRKGYKLGDKVIRYAMVKVAN